MPTCRRWAGPRWRSNPTWGQHAARCAWTEGKTRAGKILDGASAAGGWGGCGSGARVDVKREVHRDLFAFVNGYFPSQFARLAVNGLDHVPARRHVVQYE